MKSKELLDNAVDYIYDIVYGQDWICEALLDIPEEYQRNLKSASRTATICAKDVYLDFLNIIRKNNYYYDSLLSIKKYL